jgi:cation/acetate symporter
VAASANLPVIVLSIFWKRFSTAGAVAGLLVGLLSSIVLIVLSPSIMGVDAATVEAAKRHLIQRPPIFALENPGIVSIPLGFLAAALATLIKREPSAHTGLGAEKAGSH